MSTASICASEWGAAIPVDHRRRLDLLREEFRGRSDREDWVAAWWWCLPEDDRRMLCVLAGLDGSAEFADRRWERISDDNRAAIVACARSWARKLDVMRRV